MDLGASGLAAASASSYLPARGNMLSSVLDSVPTSECSLQLQRQRIKPASGMPTCCSMK